MKKFIVLILLFCFTKSKAQFDNIALKETYDMYGDYYIDETEMNASPMQFESFSDSYIEGWQALLDMYRATGDKAYLVKFAKIALWVEYNRADRGPVNNNRYNLFGYPPWAVGITFPAIPPLWFDRNAVNIPTSNGNNAPGSVSAHYYNGMILSGLTEFVNLVNNEFPSLRNANIIDKTTGHSILYGPIANPFFYRLNQDPTTLGDFVDWLLLEIDVSMPIFVQWKWVGTSFVDEVAAGPGNYRRRDGINIMGVNSSALYFYSLLRPSYIVSVYQNPPSNLYDPGVPATYVNKSYLNLALDIGFFYRGNRTYFLNLCNNTQTEPIFIERGSPYNSYKWRYVTHDYECVYGPDNNFDFEDISHANNTLQFVYRTYDGLKFSFPLLGLYNVKVFDDDFMVKLHNTFTENVLANYNSTTCATIFNAGVDGDNTIEYTTSYSGPFPVSTPSSYLESAFAFMPLQKFDGYPGAVGSIYEVLMNQYYNKCLISMGSSGTYHLALARSVKAQWEKECVNLTLYNRHLVYDQDFVVKNKLVVDPAYLTKDVTKYPFFGLPINIPDLSFSDPRVITKDFVIDANVTSNMVAGEDITFKPGFKVKAGATFHAYIQQGACTNGMKMGDSGGGEDIENNTNEKKDQVKAGIKYSVLPNPNRGVFTIEYDSNDYKENTTVSVMDMLGKEVYHTNLEESGQIIDISNFGKGMYFVEIQTPINTQVKKIIVE